MSIPVSENSRKPKGEVKRRITRACDNCRRTKTRCERASEDSFCNPCIALNLDCRFSSPTKQRGPAKGYLHAVEARCHAVEAVLGILLSLPDQRVVSLLTKLAEDSYAQRVLEQVNTSAFGPRGRAPIASGVEPSITEAQASTPATDYPDPFVHGPTNEWQDTIIHKFQADSGGQNLEPFGKMQSGMSTPSTTTNTTHTTVTSHPTHTTSVTTSVETDDSEESVEEEEGLAFGQLTISDDNQIRHRGKSSGLHLLDQSIRHTGTERGHIWHLTDYHADTKAILEELDIPMPSVDAQLRLITVFQDFDFPAFPIVDWPSFWENFQAINSFHGQPLKEKNRFKLLLLAIYALAARRPTIQNQIGIDNGDEFFERAKLILNYVYHISHLSTCQTLLFLALREFGVGALTQAWIYAGMAIRMAQDLGLHRSADRWIRDGQNVINENERSLRKRIWYGCVQIDKYMSMFMGRPVAIHRANFDTPLSEDPDAGGYQHWPKSMHEGMPPFPPLVPSRIIPCWNANSSLSVITCGILEHLFAANLASLRDEAKKLDQALDQWKENLSKYLQLNTEEEMHKATPHCIRLHMQWECTKIALQLPFIRLRSASTSNHSLLALKGAVKAASRLNDLASVFHANFGLAHALPFFSYDIFSSGTVWAAALTLDPQNSEYTWRLAQCISWLTELKSVWPSAEQNLILLQGAVLPGGSTGQPLSALYCSQDAGIPDLAENIFLPQSDIFFSTLPSEGPFDFQAMGGSPFEWLLHSSTGFPGMDGGSQQF